MVFVRVRVRALPGVESVRAVPQRQLQGTHGLRLLEEVQVGGARAVPRSALVRFLTRCEGGRQAIPVGPTYSTVADFSGMKMSVVLDFEHETPGPPPASRPGEHLRSLDGANVTL